MFKYNITRTVTVEVAFNEWGLGDDKHDPVNGNVWHFE